MGNFNDDNHALVTGALLGVLMKLGREGGGITAFPVTDDDGNYTDTIHLRLHMGDPEPTDVEIKVLP